MLYILTARNLYETYFEIEDCLLTYLCKISGGNDHEIFEDSRTIGHTVMWPEDTIDQLKELFQL